MSRMSIVDHAIQVVPGGIKSKILNSSLECVLTPFYFRISDFEDFEFPTPIGSIQLNLPTNTAFADAAKRGDYYEPNLIMAMDKSNISNGVFFDIGARYGFSSRAAALCGVDESNIYAFESSYLRHMILRRNLPQSQTINATVGNGQNNTLNGSKYARKIDKYPIAIKIDVEGAEQQVIKGLWPLLKELKPILFVEIHPGRIGSDSANEVVDNLSNLGYNIVWSYHHTTDTNWNEYSTPPTEEFLIWCQ